MRSAADKFPSFDLFNLNAFSLGTVAKGGTRIYFKRGKYLNLISHFPAEDYILDP